MFIALIQRISVLQINRMLIFTGDQGRRVITTLYQPFNSAVPAAASEEFRRLPCTQTLRHLGRPSSIQAVDVSDLVKLAERLRRGHRDGHGGRRYGRGINAAGACLMAPPSHR